MIAFKRYFIVVCISFSFFWTWVALFFGEEFEVTMVTGCLVIGVTMAYSPLWLYTFKL
jgi:hypothetical protein